MNIDRETTELIVDAYRKINSMKKLMQENPGSYDTKLIENGNELSRVLNKILDENLEKCVNENLMKAVNLAQAMIQHCDENSLNAFRINSEIPICLNNIFSDLKILQSKI